MLNRTNAGYTITNAINLGEAEIVLGKNSNGHYVTWKYSNDSGYNYGHYFEDKLLAIRDFLERSTQEINYLINLRENRGIQKSEQHCFLKVNRKQLFTLKKHGIPYDVIESNTCGNYIIQTSKLFSEAIENLFKQKNNILSSYTKR